MDKIELDDIRSKRERISEINKLKRGLTQQEYEEMRLFSEQLKQKYETLHADYNKEIEYINVQLLKYQDDLMENAFVDIQSFANSVNYLMNKNTSSKWEIVAFAFTYKKRKRGQFGLQLIDTDANLIAVAKVGIIPSELAEMINARTDWLSNNKAILAFMELVKKGDIVLLHIVEEENTTQKQLNLLEINFNGDFDKYLLRFSLEYNEKNPANMYRFLQNYLDSCIFKNEGKDIIGLK